MNKVFNKKTAKYIFDAIIIIVGTFLMGFAFNVFLNNNKISPSGFAGLSSIISNVLEQNLNIHISASVFYLAINGILFIFSYKNLGLKFAINSAIGIGSYSLFMEIVNFDIGLSGTSLLLYAIYGGVVMGIGLGLVFRGHGSTGGSDMLANLLAKKFKYITVGNMVFIVDFIVIILSLIAYNNLELALYSLIAIYLMTKMSDVIVSGVQSLRAYYIISDKYQEIAKTIMAEADRGVTNIKSQGMYTSQDKNVLLTIVTRAEAVKLRQIVADIDKNAFMFSCPIAEAMGKGFMPLNNPSKKAKQKEVGENKLKDNSKENQEIYNINDETNIEEIDQNNDNVEE